MPFFASGAHVILGRAALWFQTRSAAATHGREAVHLAGLAIAIGSLWVDAWSRSVAKQVYWPADPDVARWQCRQGGPSHPAAAGGQIADDRDAGQ